MKQKLLSLSSRRGRRWLGALTLALIVLGSVGALRAQVVEGHRLTSWADASGRIRIPDGVTELAPGALKGNEEVSHIDFNRVRLIGAEACAEMSALTGFDAPEVEELGARAFKDAGPSEPDAFFTLTVVRLPKCRRVGDEAMQWNAGMGRRGGLSYLALPVVEQVGANLFKKSVKMLDLSRAGLSEADPSAFAHGERFILPDEATKEQFVGANVGRQHYLASDLPTTSSPYLSCEVKAPRGTLGIELELPRFGSTQVGQFVAIDLGDGELIYQPLGEEMSSQLSGINSTLWGMPRNALAFHRLPIDNPTIKFYVGSVDYLDARRIIVKRLSVERLLPQLNYLGLSLSEGIPMPDLSVATQLKTIQIEAFSGQVATSRVLDLSELHSLSVLHLLGIQQLEALKLSPRAQLTELFIRRLSDLSDLPWSQLTGVKELTASYCALKGRVDLGAYRGLRKLDLSNNQITHLVLPTAMLESFDCSSNKLEDVQLAAAPPNLTTASIQGNRLRSVGMNALYKNLTDRSTKSEGKLYVLGKVDASPSEDNDAFASDLAVLKQKNWRAVDVDERELSGMIVRGDTLISWNTASGDVVLPPEVKVIARWAIPKNDQVTSISGENVEYIEYHLGRMPNLERLYFPKLKGYSEHPLRNSWENADFNAVASGGEYDKNVTRIDTHWCELSEVPKLQRVLSNEVMLYEPKTTEGVVILPDEVTIIESAAFKDCSKITKVIGRGVRELKGLAFEGCTALEEVDFPLLERTLGYPFDGCPKLKSVRNAKGIWVWTEASGQIVVPEGVEVLGAHVFEGNKAVTGVQLPATLKRIGRAAFADTNIEEMSLPSALQSIGAFAFAGSKLRRATIPESVERVGTGMFLLCSQLEELEYLAKAPILRAGTLGIYGHSASGKPALRRLVLGRHIQGFEGSGRNDEFNYPWYYLLMSKGMRIEELVCHSPEPMLLERYVNRVKRLYVPAGLLEVYRAEDRKYPEMKDLRELYPIEGTEGDKLITIPECEGYKIYVRAGEREVRSGERLPVGTELYAYVVPEVGKIVTSLKVNHYDDAYKQWKRYTLSQDMTFTATVADFDAEQYEELYAIDYLGERGKIEAHTFETRTSIRNKYTVIDLGGGRYAYCDYDQVFAATLWEVVPRFAYAENNPRVRYLYAKRWAKEHGAETLKEANFGYRAKFLAPYKAFHPTRPELCASLYIRPGSQPYIPGSRYRLNLPDLSQMTSLSSVEFNLYRLDVTPCDLDDFYRSLPTHTDAPRDQFDKVIYVWPKTDPAFEKSDITLLQAKGWRAVHGNYELIPTTPGGGCKAFYALAVQSNVEGVSYRYFEDGVEKPLPTQVARGKEVCILPVYDSNRYEEPQLSFAASPHTYGMGYNSIYDTWSCTFTMEQDISLSLAFSRKINYYAVTSSSSEGGSLTISGASDLARVLEGTSLTVVAIPAEGYELVSLTAGGEDIKASGRFVVTANTEVRATFRKKTYSVSLTPVTGGSVRIIGFANLSAVPHGTELRVEATAAEGYELLSLTAGGEDITASGRFVVTANTEVRATFRKRTYSVTLPSVPNARLAIKGNPDLSAVSHGTELELEVTPDAGYEVEAVRIDGRALTRPYRFTVAGSPSIEVQIRQKTALETAEAQAPHLYPNPATTYIIVEGAEIGARVGIYSLEGVLLREEKISERTQRIPVGELPRGVYLVRLGESIYRLVVK
ncbi:MAG: leucine-rich repeat protein [Porphyromonadaceae bacterium]|nr:leucine-rich repeat protein [Porphyromonadaceae bacterium]